MLVAPVCSPSPPPGPPFRSRSSARDPACAVDGYWLAIELKSSPRCSISRQHMGPINHLTSLPSFNFLKLARFCRQSSPGDGPLRVDHGDGSWLIELPQAAVDLFYRLALDAPDGGHAGLPGTPTWSCVRPAPSRSLITRVAHRPKAPWGVTLPQFLPRRQTNYVSVH